MLADTLSKVHLCEVALGSSVEAEVETINMIQYWPISKERLKEIHQQTEDDNIRQKLKLTILQG